MSETKFEALVELSPKQSGAGLSPKFQKHSALKFVGRSETPIPKAKHIGIG